MVAAPPGPVPTGTRQEYREFCAKVESGDPFAVAEALRDLAGKETGRPLPAGERRLFLQATEILASELAVALSMSVDRATSIIAEALMGGGR